MADEGVKGERQIEERTIAKTDNCIKGFSCLSSGGEDLCKVEEGYGRNVHFVECRDLSKCNYRTPFGDSNLCSCPVRQEFYNKYEI